MALLYILSYFREYNQSEYFTQQCSKLIKPTCEKKSIFAAISKLEEDLNELVYLTKNKSKDNYKYAEMYSWYKKKLVSDNRFNNDAKKNAEDIGKQFIKEAASKINKDMSIVNKTARKKISKDKARLHKKYKPLRLK